MRQNIFIFLFFSFFSNFVQNNITEYLYGNPLKDNQNEEGEHDDCDCIVENNKCNYLCCCDKKCPSEAITDWKNHFKCTDERDVVGIFEDRCIDKNLVFKNWSTRGLYIETETEDILHNAKKTLKNYCYATDNSGNMAKNLIRIDELDKHGYKNIYGENSENS